MTYDFEPKHRYDDIGESFSDVFHVAYITHRHIDLKFDTQFQRQSRSLVGTECVYEKKEHCAN